MAAGDTFVRTGPLSAETTPADGTPVRGPSRPGNALSRTQTRPKSDHIVRRRGEAPRTFSDPNQGITEMLGASWAGRGDQKSDRRAGYGGLTFRSDSSLTEANAPRFAETATQNNRLLGSSTRG